MFGAVVACLVWASSAAGGVHDEQAAHQALSEGLALFNQRDFEGAASLYQRAITLEPRSWPVAYFNLGLAHLETHSYRAAYSTLRVAHQLDPRDPQPLQYGSTAARELCSADTANAINLAAQGHKQEAETQLMSLVQLLPQCSAAYEVLGPLLLMKGQAGHALESCSIAARIKPDSVKATRCKAVALMTLKRYPEALASLGTEHESTDLLVLHLYCGIGMCKWSDRRKQRQRLAQSALHLTQRSVKTWAERVSVDLRSWVAENLQMPPEFILTIAKQRAIAAALGVPKAYRFRYTTLGCSSCARHSSAAAGSGPPEAPRSSRSVTSHQTSENTQSGMLVLLPLCALANAELELLTVLGVFKRHNSHRFEIHALATHPGSGDAHTALFPKAVHMWHQLGGRPKDQAAQLVGSLQLSVLIDLNGHTRGAQSRLFALRSSGVAAAMIGSSSSVGAEYVPYICGDRFSNPPSLAHTVSEKVVLQPASHHPSSYEDLFTPPRGARKRYKFSFVSAGRLNKLTPTDLRVWAQVLRRAEGSQLALLVDPADAVEQLRQELGAAGINWKRRLQGMDRTSKREHLERLASQDVALDTFAVNGMSSGLDIAYAGLPAVGTMGERMNNRFTTMVASNLGLQSTIRQSLKEYEDIAFTLASK